MTTKTLYTCAWGDYWSLYGEQWLRSVEMLNTKPDEIFVLSDKHIECPHKVIIVDARNYTWPISKFRQTASNRCTSDWICPVDIDDIMYSNYLDDIKDDYDVHAHYPDNSHEWWKDGQMRWDMAFETDNWQGAAFCGVSFIKTKLIKETRVSLYGHQDVVLYYQLKLKNAKVFFDKTQRFYYNRTPESLSSNSKSIKTKSRETQKVYEQLKSIYKTQNY